MLITKIGKKQVLRNIMAKNFGAAGPVKYDWRTDPKYNPFFTTEFSDVGLEGQVLQCPILDAKHNMDPVLPPADVDLSSPHVNYSPHLVIPKFITPIRQADFHLVHDMDHEADFGSEDMDFQPDDFRTQHFHKQGWVWPWFFMGFAGAIYFAMELAYQHYPDHNFFKKPFPLGLNHPDSNFSKADMEIYEQRDRINRFIYDSGYARPKWKIENNEFVFDRFAGVNQAKQEH